MRGAGQSHASVLKERERVPSPLKEIGHAPCQAAAQVFPIVSPHLYFSPWPWLPAKTVKEYHIKDVAL